MYFCLVDTRAPESTFKRILEACFIKLIVPSLNEQSDNNVLMLFRNGVTTIHILMILLFFLII